jgi:hypothetical protein
VKYIGMISTDELNTVVAASTRDDGWLPQQSRTETWPALNGRKKKERIVDAASILLPSRVRTCKAGGAGTHVCA